MTSLNYDQCFLDAFIGVNATDVEQWAESFYADVGAAVPKVALTSALLVASLIALFFGARLVKPVLFVSTFGVALVACFYATVAVVRTTTMDATAACWVEGLVPLVVALLAAFFVVNMLTLAFACLGAASGAAGGYYLYALVLHTIPTGDVPPLGGHTWVFWLSVLLSSVVAAALAVKFKHLILATATAGLGAVGALVATTMLLLSHIDPKFLWCARPRNSAQSPAQFSDAPSVLTQAPRRLRGQRPPRLAVRVRPADRHRPRRAPRLRLPAAR